MPETSNQKIAEIDKAIMCLNDSPTFASYLPEERVDIVSTLLEAKRHFKTE